MRPVFVRVVLAFVASLSVATASAQTKQTFAELRTNRRLHFRLEAPGASYTATSIFQYGEERVVSTVLLLDSATGQQLVLDSIMDYARSEHRTEVRDVEAKQSISLHYALPFKGRTHSEAVAAMEEGKLSDFEEDIVLTAGGMSRAAKTDDWLDPVQSRDWRSEIRRAASPSVLEALERLRGIAASTGDLDFLCVLFLRLILYNETCTRAEGVTTTTIEPDCDFDESFGYPCNARQLERVKKARQNLKAPFFY